jgi:hypothetical protein
MRSSRFAWLLLRISQHLCDWRQNDCQLRKPVFLHFSHDLKYPVFFQPISDTIRDLSAETAEGEITPRPP